MEGVGVDEFELLDGLSLRQLQLSSWAGAALGALSSLDLLVLIRGGWRTGRRRIETEAVRVGGVSNPQLVVITPRFFSNSVHRATKCT